MRKAKESETSDIKVRCGSFRMCVCVEEEAFNACRCAVVVNRFGCRLTKSSMEGMGRLDSGTGWRNLEEIWSIIGQILIRNYSKCINPNII